MRRSTTLISIVSLAAGLSAVAVAPASADGTGQPAGSGANGCYLVLPAAGQADGSGSSQTLKINVGNPASVALAGSCDGAAGPNFYVDDDLRITTSQPNGAGGTQTLTVGTPAGSWFGGCTDPTQAPWNVTGLFGTGTHTVTVTDVNDPTCNSWYYGNPSGNGNIYLIVKQRG